MCWHRASTSAAAATATAATSSSSAIDYLPIVYLGLHVDDEPRVLHRASAFASRRATCGRKQTSATTRHTSIVEGHIRPYGFLFFFYAFWLPR
jgi:hypothetical protein